MNPEFSIPRKTVDAITNANSLGLLVFLISSGATDLTGEAIQHRLKLNRAQFRKAVRELESLKLTERCRVRDESGQLGGWRWTVTAHLSASTSKPIHHSRFKPQVVKRPPGEINSSSSISLQDSSLTNSDKEKKQTEKNNVLREQFLKLWSLFFEPDPSNPKRKIPILGKTGVQHLAWAQWQRLNPKPEFGDQIIARCQNEIRSRKKLMRDGEFVESFPHIFRLIRDKRYLEYPENHTNTKEFFY